MTVETLSRSAAISKCGELAALVARHTSSKGNGLHATEIKQLKFRRESDPSTAIQGICEPVLGIIVQAQKEVLLNQETYRYGIAQYLLVTVDLPFYGFAVEATPDQPYLAFKLDLDLVQLCDIIVQLKWDISKKENSVRGWFISDATPALVDCAIKLTQLLDTPQDIPFLAPLIIREIYYRLLVSEQGGAVRQIATSSSNMQRIAEAIRRIKTDFTQPLRVEDLARRVNMPLSSFHHHFKKVTSMSPLQYQKQLRLLEARRLMLVEHSEVSNAAYQVGYESPSQFSREYSRMFGVPPIRDIERLK